MKVYIVIPVFNEAQVVVSVIQMVRSYGWKNIIVVDDGSTDGTYKKAQSTSAIVVRHSVNCGKGAAIVTGIQLARNFRADAVVTLDGDMQHHGQDVSKLIAPLKKRYDVVLGSRFMSNNSIPFFRRLSNVVANIITAIFCGIWVSDSQCGMRAYGKEALRKLEFQGDRYEFESEVLRSIKKTKLTYKEVPISVRYTKYSMTKATRQSFSSSIETLIALLQKT